MGQVRTWKETDQARGTHFLETALRGTNQNTKRNRPSKGYSLSRGHIGRDKSGHGKKRRGEGRSLPEDHIERDESGYGEKPAEQGPLTSWRPGREGNVWSRKETDRARGTHTLETGSGGTGQDTERNRPSERHSHPGDRIKRDKSGHGKTPAQRGTPTS